MEYTFRKIKKELRSVSEDKLPPIISPPPHIEADLSLPFSSRDEAESFSENLKVLDSEFIKKVDTKDNFVNIRLKRQETYRSVLEDVITHGQSYGHLEMNDGKKAFIEYSSPNIAKPIGIGHLRSTIIGEALSRIYGATGFEVFRSNYLGDWGTQFGQLIVAFRKWGSDKDLKGNPLENLKDLYVKFQKEAETQESLKEEAREVFKKLEKGDKEVRKLWKKFRKISIEEFKEVYKRLGVEFDEFGGESFIADKASDEVKNCLDKEVCSEGEYGAVVVEELNDLPTFLLRKEDGSTLYMTRDLATLRERVEDQEPDTVLYVVGNEQELHFRQLFKLADALGFLDGTIPKHISFGLVTIDGSPMSTREGTLIKLDDLLDKAVDKAGKIISEKNPDLSDEKRKEVARKVGIGSVIYNDLSQHRNKNVDFDWNKMLDFSAGSGPYLQYTYARIKSILRKAGEFDKDINKLDLSEEIEFEVARKLMFFSKAIYRAYNDDAPHVICGYLEDLASDFNKFYEAVSVLDTEDEELKSSRLALIWSVSQVIKSGLNLLNIEVPEEM